jgi:hypothetical protein
MAQGVWEFGFRKARYHRRDEMSKVETNDGVAASVRGDLVLSLWQSSARVHRTRWFFDILDAAAARNPDGIMAMLIILPTASPPDGPARAENATRLRKLGKSVRRVVTVPLGNPVFVTVVRTVMRAMFLVQGQSEVQMVESSILTGIRRVLEGGSPLTPGRAQVEADVTALYHALQLTPFDPKAQKQGVSAPH